MSPTYIELVRCYKEESEGIPYILSKEALNEEVQRQIQRRTEVLNEKSKGISDSTFKILQTFSIIGREHIYSERYTIIYDFVLKSNNNRDYLINRLATKGMLRYVVCGMKECGQISYIRLIEKYACELL